MAQLPNLGVSHMVRSATGTVSSVLEAADLLSNYITKVKQDQVVDHKIHRAEYTERAITAAAQRSAERKIDLQTFADKSDLHATYLQEAIDKFTAILESK